MKKTGITVTVLLAVLAVFSPSPVRANNMHVTNTVLTFCDEVSTYVTFDISWENSWRQSWTEGTATITNWDAAWVFVKYRVGAGDWCHASLSITNSDHRAPTGSTINAGLSVDGAGTNFGAGVFFYRSDNGMGSWNQTNVQLRWMYARDSVSLKSTVDVCVSAIEMVYVPGGSYYLGSPATQWGSFSVGGGSYAAFYVTNEASIMVSNSVDCLWTDPGYLFRLGPTNSPIPDAYPKGFQAFYCMKYEVSQGQYADFLNMLAAVQSSNRYFVSAPINGYTISGTYPDITNTSPNTACNYLSWADGSAYADWAGLRPMSEFEFEKACRGPLPAAGNEYAWSGNRVQLTNVYGVVGSGMETALPVGANYWMSAGGGNFGALRCGIYAASLTNSATTNRQDSGASYWGIMEMSANVTERPVSISGNNSRLFTGTHGDGVLDTNGSANAATWPGTNAVGVASRGMGWGESGWGQFQMADRLHVNDNTIGRGGDLGFRGVRTEP